VGESRRFPPLCPFALSIGSISEATCSWTTASPAAPKPPAKLRTTCRWSPTLSSPPELEAAAPFTPSDDRSSSRSRWRWRPQSWLPGLQRLFQPPQRPDVARAGGRIVDTQHQRRLAIRELLEVPQGDDLAVRLGHGVDRLLQLEL